MAPFIILFPCLLSGFSLIAGEKMVVLNIPLCTNSTKGNGMMTHVAGIPIPPSLVYAADGNSPSLEINLTFPTQEFTCSTAKHMNAASDLEDDDLSNLVFTIGGYIGFLHPDNETITDWFHHSEVCVYSFPNNDTRSSSILAMRACEHKRIDSETGTVSYETPIWVSKCCPPGYVQDRRTHGMYKCMPSPLPGIGWVPRFYDGRTFNTGRCVSESQKKVFYRYFTTKDVFDGYGIKLPSHPSQRALDNATNSRVRWRLLEDGSLAVAVPPANRLHLHSTWEIYKDGYCVDGFINFHSDKIFENTVSRIAKFKPDPTIKEHRTVNNISYFTQNGTDLVEFKPGMQSNFFVATYLGSLCPLIFTAAAYFLTWKTHNVHGWTILTHILALIGSNLLAGTSAILSWDYTNLDTLSCALIGMFTHFFYLVSYTWLTMINFDLWWTFRVVSAHNSKSKKGLVRYLIYACVATFIPVTIIAIAGRLNVVHGQYGGSAGSDGDSGEDSDCETIAPNYGSINCHVHNQGQGVYIYYPLAVLFVINMGLYLATVLNVFPRVWANSLGLKSAEHRRSALLFLKLFVVSGVGLGFDFIGWISEPNSASPEDISLPFFLIFVFNILGRAFALFFIFAWKEETRKIVAKAIWKKSCTSARTTYTPDHSGAYTGEILEMNSGSK